MNIFLFLVLFFCLVVLYYLRNGAIYLPTSKTAIQTMLKLASIKPGMKLADLGSGDGRVLIAFTKLGVLTTGYENNPLLALWSRWKIKRLGLSATINVKLTSFWREDLSSYDVVVVFGMTHIMDRLEKKLKKEMKPGSQIISNVFKFKNLDLSVSDRGVSVYKIPETLL